MVKVALGRGYASVRHPDGFNLSGWRYSGEAFFQRGVLALRTLWRGVQAHQQLEATVAAWAMIVKYWHGVFLKFNRSKFRGSRRWPHS
jgi:hypothetical protein